MTLTKKIAAYFIAGIIACPAIMVLNSNPETIHLNVIGMAYCWMVVRYRHRIVPAWVTDYFRRVARSFD